jgi:BirA family biotin operon repressor/biotin-[acetyl-CoA-carboxylase] ligase
VIGQRAHRHLSECDSTNDLARTWISDPTDPAPHGACVTADFQTRGRGRRGRTWDAAPGQNVLLSVVLRPEFPRVDAWQLAFLAALAVIDVLTEYGLDPRLKWPNDILLDNKKVAGILVETVSSMSPGGWAAVVGIGLNANQDRFDVPERLLHPATSLRLVTKRDWDVPDLAHAVADALLKRTAEREALGWDTVWEACRQCMAVGTTLQRGTERATLTDIERDGSARVRLIDGTFVRWASVQGDEGPEIRPNSV